MESTLDRGVLHKQRSLAEVELLHEPLEAGAPFPKLGISRTIWRVNPIRTTEGDSKDLAISPSAVPTSLKAVLPFLPTTDKPGATSDYGGIPLASSVDTTTVKI
jgi:hypothetical protein